MVITEYNFQLVLVLFQALWPQSFWNNYQWFKNRNFDLELVWIVKWDCAKISDVGCCNILCRGQKNKNYKRQWHKHLNSLEKLKTSLFGHLEHWQFVTVIKKSMYPSLFIFLTLKNIDFLFYYHSSFHLQVTFVLYLLCIVLTRKISMGIH